MIERHATLHEKLYECRLHIQRLQRARKHIKNYIPIESKSYNNLSDETMSFIDQMIYRFSKLQDTMGEKIFTTILELGGEPIKQMTFIDKLNRLEELELVDRAEWMMLRKERNEIAHEYSFNTQEVVDSINAIHNKARILIETFETIERYAQLKYGDKLS